MLLTLKIIWKLGKDKKLYIVKRSVCHRFGGRREGINRWSTKRGWNFSVWFYKGGYTTLYICQNLRHSITLRVNLKSCMHACSVTSVLSDSLRPLWTVVRQDPLFMGFSQQEYWESVDILSSRGSSQPRDGSNISYVSCIGRWVLYHYRHLGSP